MHQVNLHFTLSWYMFLLLLYVLPYFYILVNYPFSCWVCTCLWDQEFDISLLVLCIIQDMFSIAKVIVWIHYGFGWKEGRYGSWNWSILRDQQSLSGNNFQFMWSCQQLCLMSTNESTFYYQDRSSKVLSGCYNKVEESCRF